MQNPSWTLIDAEKLAEENKYTFGRASQEAIAALKVGDDVKLGFRLNVPAFDGTVTERMWVEIEMIDGSGGFIGWLQNQPRHIKDLGIKDKIRFSECHIMNTGNDEAYPRNELIEKFQALCLCSSKILKDEEKVAVLFREAPEIPEDSGWRFFAGTETETYLSGERSMQCVSLGFVLRHGDAFVDLLESPVGAYFELDQETGQFKAAHPGSNDQAGNDTESRTLH